MTTRFDINDFAAWVQETYETKLTLKDARFIESLASGTLQTRARKDNGRTLSDWLKEYTEIKDGTK